MGAVYLAVNNKSAQPAAIKLMLPAVAADDKSVALFQREIRNCKALSHRNIARLLDDGYAQGAFFMVMEFCDGGSVADLMKARGGKLSVEEACDIILDALEGLDYAHKADIPFVKQKGGGFTAGKGLVHRDLKPANLFLAGSGSGRIVKLGDFGLAKAFEETGLTGGTRTGVVAGTWHFMCRQQLFAYKHAGPEVDVWAMAASLYAMLTGRTPRRFTKDKDPWLVVAETKPVPIRERSADIPGPLADLIDRALQDGDEGLPFRTAAQLREELEKVV